VVQLTDPARPDGLFTGYYEPTIEGSRERTRTYHVPLRARPADLIEQTDTAGVRQFGRLQDGAFVPYYTRAEIDHGALRRQRLDLLYLKSPIDLFFLQIQGAGRIELPNGHEVRVGTVARNGQPYMPIGRVLSDRGDLAPDQVSAQSIRDWLTNHPREAAATMELNPSYTFFREIPDLDPDKGPLGTLGVQLTPLRSIAVDPTRVPLAAPVWIDTTTPQGGNPDGGKLQRLMLAQDTGAAIAGSLRADIFFGWDAAAEDQAGRQQAPGRAWLLVPKAAPES
jgi:membrane-bound lytic murein transglycosylase A